MVSGTSSPGDAESARCTAASTRALAPTAYGVGARRRRPWLTSGIPWSKRCWTTNAASSGASPPIGTPETVTPGGTSDGASVVVVPVAVVASTAPTPSASTNAEKTPAAAQVVKARAAEPGRLTQAV